MTLTGHDRTLQQYWRADIAQVTGVTPGPQPDPADYPTITAGAGLTGGGDLSVSRTLAVGAGDGITVNADDVALASAVAGAGLTYTVGVLAVGAGLGLTVNANDVALTTPGSLTATSANSSAGSHTHAIDSTIARSAITITGTGALGGGGALTGNQTITLNTPGTLSVSSTNNVGTNHTHAITAVDTSTAAAALMKTNAAGGFTFADGASFGFADVVLSRIGANVLGLASGDAFETSYTSGWAGSGYHLDYNQSYANQSFLELDRLSVRGIMSVYELLVHQIRATNGSIFVSSTAKAQSVIDNGGGSYTIVCETDHGFLAADLIRAQRFTGTGTYQCDMTVTNVLSSVQFAASLRATYTAPAAGMEFVRLGSTSDADRQGSIYLTADDTNAPYINILAGVAAFTDWGTTGKTKMRMGNLNGSYGVVANTFGVGIGQYGASTSNVLVTDAGISIVGKTVERIGLTAAGELTIKDGAGAAVITLDATTGAEITKKLTMPGANSAIAIGATPPTSATVGTGIWIDRTGMYGLAANVQQAIFDAATGGITAGAGAITANASGLGINEAGKLRFTSSATLRASVWADVESTTYRMFLHLTDSTRPQWHFTAGDGGFPGAVYSEYLTVGTFLDSGAADQTGAKVLGKLGITSGNWIGLGAAAGRLLFTDAATDVLSVETADWKVNGGNSFLTGGLNLGTATGAAAGKVYALLANAAGALEVARFGIATGGVAGSQDLVIGSYGASYGAGIRAVYDYTANTNTQLALMYTAAGVLTEGARLDASGYFKLLSRFGCNNATPQAAYASGGALNAYGAGANGLDSGANMSALHAMVVKIRAALVANGIMS